MFVSVTKKRDKVKLANITEKGVIEDVGPPAH